LRRRSVQRLIPASASVTSASVAATATRVPAAAGVATTRVAAARVTGLGWIDLDVLGGRADVLLARLVAVVMRLGLAATRILDRRLHGLQ
jgi:hypothetical protein